MNKLLPGLFKFPHGKRGFTLIELIVVITVISVLTAIAVVSFGTIQSSARDASRKQAITSIQTALERYYGDNQLYPAGPFNTMVASLVPNYMATAPTDPCGKVSLTTAGPFCSGTRKASYLYTLGTSSQSYTITLTPESGAGNVSFYSPQ